MSIEKTALSATVQQGIDDWLQKYPADQKPSALPAALRLAQEANGGWLREGDIRAVAAYLDIPVIRAFEVATFYSMYNLKPVGRHQINVCTNISCMLRGSDDVVNHLQQKLDIPLGETTRDGRFTLKAVECLGACVGAPMMMVGKTYYENLTPDTIDGILASLTTTDTE